MKVLYIADLGEDIKKSKADADSLYGRLMERCQDDATELEIMADDLATTDPAHILVKCLLDGAPDLIVGKDFAAVFALLIGRATQCRTILLNPMYPVYRYLPYEIPEYEFTDLLNSLEFERICWDKRETTLNNVFVILGEDDDVTDAKRTEGYFAPGNCIYVRGEHNPSGDDFKDILNILITHLLDGPECVREMLDAYKHEESSEESGRLPIKERATDQEADETLHEDKPSKIAVLSGNDRIVVDMSMGATHSADEGKKRAAFDPDCVKVDEVRSENGNIVIKWHFKDAEARNRFLYLYYKDGVWHRDEEDGFPSKTYILEAVLREATGKFLEQTEITDHIGQNYWGWDW